MKLFRALLGLITLALSAAALALVGPDALMSTFSPEAPDGSAKWAGIYGDRPRDGLRHGLVAAERVTSDEAHRHRDVHRSAAHDETMSPAEPPRNTAGTPTTKPTTATTRHPTNKQPASHTSTTVHQHLATPVTTVQPASARAPSGSQTITGDACPCTVNGSAALVGQVNLRGDLIVVGGTLTARPGVTVNGNGHQIMFMHGGKADFQGTKVFTWSGNGSNANLTRDINFRNLRRVMFHEGAGPSILKYFIISNSGGPAIGDYPLHFHLNGNSTRGTLVEGVVVQDSRNRAFVPHGSHGITFKDTIAKNIVGEAYWWDSEFVDPATGVDTGEACDSSDACEPQRFPVNQSHDIIFDHALADGVFANGALSHPLRMNAFTLGRGNNNSLTNSVAINVNGGSQCSGFHWPADESSTWNFDNNFSESPKCRGIFVWQNTSHQHVITNFRGSIEHGAYRNGYQYRNIDSDVVIVHANSREVEDGAPPITFQGGRIGRVIMDRHQVPPEQPTYFIDIAISEFIVDNGGGDPGHYVLENVGLSCGDIVYQSVSANTRVIIDGEEC